MGRMQTAYKVGAAVLAAVLVCIAVFSIYAFWDSDRLISEHENRTLATMPPLTAQEWFSSDYGTALDEYLSDHVLWREELIPVTRALERLMRVQSRIRVVDISKPN
jgi:hypothetical protein